MILRTQAMAAQDNLIAVKAPAMHFLAGVLRVYQPTNPDRSHKVSTLFRANGKQREEEQPGTAGPVRRTWATIYLDGLTSSGPWSWTAFSKLLLGSANKMREREASKRLA